MSPKLDEIFGELGISQYLDAFVDQGFDTWETILDITESDLDALGVKLGHRRKLQRRIANARGIAPDAALVSPTRPSVEDARVEVHRPDGPAPPPPDARDTGTAAVQKRKYRRHPKADENAPERPPSAYVLFSNKMREDLKGQNLTFTEIAKLVGENWQGLNQAEKEPYERQAQAAKEKYNQDLAEYKKTLEYKKYLQYLQDFKAKHATHQDKDGHKRVRLSEPNTGESSATNGHSGRAGRMGSTAGSIGEHTGEPPTRRQRISSIVSNVDSYYAPSVNSLSQRTPGEDSITSPATGYFERLSEPSPAFTASPRDGSSQASVPVRRDPVYVDGVRSDPVAPTRNLPPLADMFDTRPVPNGVPHPNEAPTPHFGLLSRGHETISPAPPTPSLAGDDSRRPSLKTEQSSAGSLSSGSSSYNSSHPRTPIDGPLPIHALLTGGKPFPSYDTAYATNSAAQGRSLSPDDRGTLVYYASERAPSEPGAAGHPMPHINGYYSGPTPMSTHASSASLGRLPYANGRQARVPVPVPTAAPASASAPVPGVRPSGKGDAGMDGISALLQADKIVDRRSG